VANFQCYDPSNLRHNVPQLCTFEPNRPATTTLVDTTRIARSLPKLLFEYCSGRNFHRNDETRGEFDYLNTAKYEEDTGMELHGCVFQFCNRICLAQLSCILDLEAEEILDVDAPDVALSSLLDECPPMNLPGDRKFAEQKFRRFRLVLPADIAETFDHHDISSLVAITSKQEVLLSVPGISASCSAESVMALKKNEWYI
jgi:hypothetical protein